MKVGEVNKFGILVLETGYGRWYWDVALFEAAVYVPRGARDNDPDHSIGIYRADTQRLDFVLRKVVEYMTRVGLEVFYPPEILTNPQATRAVLGRWSKRTATAGPAAAEPEFAPIRPPRRFEEICMIPDCGCAGPSHA